MKHFKIWQKLALLSFVFLMPFAVVTYEFIDQITTTGIDFTQKELDGTEYIGPLRDFLRDAQRHRTLSQAVLLGDKSVAGRLAEAQKTWRTSTLMLGNKDEDLGATLKTSAISIGHDASEPVYTTWQALKGRAEKLSQSSRTQSAEQSLAEHNELIEQTLLFLAHVSDESNLTLDPELDSYYLMNIVVFQAPETKELMSQTRAIGAAACARRRLTSEQRDELIRLATLIMHLRDKVGLSLDKASEKTRNEDVKKQIDAMRNELRGATIQFSAAIKTLLDTPPGEAPALSAAAFIKSTDNAIDEWQALQEKALPALRQLLKVRHASARRSLVMTLATAGIGLCAVLFSALWITRDITQPLKRTLHIANKIADGDLAVQQKTENRHDENGQLQEAFERMAASLREKAVAAEQIASGDLRSGGLHARLHAHSDRDVLGMAFERMVANLQQMLADVREAVSILSAAATQIVASTSQLTASSEETATAVTETTATVEEVRQTAHLSSQKARQVAEGAQQAAIAAHSGRQATDESGHGMSRIRTQMDSIADSMVRLSEQSQAIGAIIASVDDLTQQSNLLSVNAAIEAAKAGEHGKGFAVVAHEVKSLAEQSRQATLQVRTILSDIQKATGNAVMATEQGSKAVETGVEQANQAGDAIERLAGSVELAAQSAMQIAASSQEQLIGMDQVALAMESVRQASHHNVESAQQLQASARGLSDLGARLRELVEKYQV